MLGNVFTRIFLWPVVFVYYSLDVAEVAGASGLFMIYLFFLIGALTNAFAANILVKMYYRQERFEGNYRFVCLFYQRAT